MHTSLRTVVLPFACVVVAALAPVVLVAFLTIPYNLGGHPGEVRSEEATVGWHMT
jgi:hypothetical protein